MCPSGDGQGFSFRSFHEQDQRQEGERHPADEPEQIDEGLHLFIAVPTDSIAVLRNAVHVIDALDNAMAEELSGMTQH